MSYHSSKTAYTQIAPRLIYILHTQDSPYYYIGHCRHDLIKAVYNAHLRGEYYKTRNFVFELKAKGLRPCLHILEKVTATKVIAYCHVIAWTRILDNAAYETLDTGHIIEYMGDLFGQALIVFEANQFADIPSILKCDSCAAKTANRVPCPLWSTNISD